MSYPRIKERGNALWFILIAVALLGLLTMVLTRSGSSVDQSGDVEQNKVKLSELLRYTKGVQTALEQMKLRGVSENDISFQNTLTTINYTNANCTTTDCRVFDAGGAGLTIQNFTALNDGSEWIFTGANNVGTTAGPIGTTAAGTGNDLIMLLPHIKPALCKQINRDLGVDTTGTIPEDATGIATTAFTGSFATGGLVVLDGDGTPFELNNHEAGCFTDTAATPDVTYFYQVILAR